MQPGEVTETYADIEKSTRLLNFRPTVQLEEGILHFIDWFKSFHRLGEDVFESMKCE